MIRLIPPQCLLERDVAIFGRKLLHIPPMCKINPLYEELMALRFRALCPLEEEASSIEEAEQS
ncbi:Mo-dependent nitrogenase C-terminal domain-containing protein [Synechococcus sp. CCFWC 502]|uniref:Mo-dependent nitrogenase C-terminal domain-containing protein n=1 Tax=unclassified Synechococcus TaxID=2626047 RepID=UPI001E55CBC9|nr:Mo-dependent nitrogenase C-terminal domain-containing protein [Synechococcus sp. CCFWC 502]WFN60495.1 Mo-dependent nitrogenase C-terminal domain-containing protein [Synechococcus sp. CCFWC 502]